MLINPIDVLKNFLNKHQTDQDPINAALHLLHLEGINKYSGNYTPPPLPKGNFIPNAKGGNPFNFRQELPKVDQTNPGQNSLYKLNHYLRKGETPQDVANWSGQSVTDLQKWNSKDLKTMKQGDLIIVPKNTGSI